MLIWCVLFVFVLLVCVIIVCWFNVNSLKSFSMFKFPPAPFFPLFPPMIPCKHIFNFLTNGGNGGTLLQSKSSPHVVRAIRYFGPPNGSELANGEDYCGEGCSPCNIYSSFTRYYAIIFTD